MRTAKGARIGFGNYSESGGAPAVVLEGSSSAGILLSGTTFADAIYIDEPYKYDQSKKVATLSEVSSTIDNKLTSYVTKAEVEPYTMIPGYAASAYIADMATRDGKGHFIDETYATKTDLTAKQDWLPYNWDTGLYSISVSSAASVPWSGVTDKPAAVVISGTYEDGTTFTFNL